ncbi:hypothetical protein D3C76_1541760 [compost metagenome]
MPLARLPMPEASDACNFCNAIGSLLVGVFSAVFSWFTVSRMFWVSWVLTAMLN